MKNSNKWETKTLKAIMTHGAFSFPSQVFNENCLLTKMHFEVVRAQRWDLTDITRVTRVICLN